MCAFQCAIWSKIQLQINDNSRANMAYNLISFKVLEKVSAITHSIITIMKRIYVVFGSMVVLSTPLTNVQLVGILIADSGCLLYSYIKMTVIAAPFKSNLSNKLTNFIKRLIIFTLVSVILTSFVYEAFKTTAQVHIYKNHVDPLWTIPGIIKENNVNNDKRIMCLNKIKQEIIETFQSIIPKENDVHLIDVPVHGNYGDTLIW